MFNPADFDALAALVERRYSRLPDNHHMKHERSEVLWCIHVARQTAKEYGMMAPEPAPVQLCQEERLAALLDRWEKRIEDLNKEFKIAKAAGRWQHVIQLEAYAVELMARRNEIRDMLKQSEVRLCQECGAAPAKSYSRLCEACYAIAIDEIRAELAQEQAAIVDAGDDALEIVG